MDKKIAWMMLIGLSVISNAYAQDATPNDDPYEDYNRHMYTIDDTIDRAVFKPVATLYQTVTPSFFRTGVTNFFDNINSIPTVFNDVLQWNMPNAGNDSLRFLVNSTLGVGGVLDPATKMGLEYNSQDFGLTMAKWGYTSSDYLVLPVLGPSTVRDTIALPVNYASAGNIFVFNFYPFVSDSTGYILTGTNFVNSRANILQFDPVRAQAFDPYVFVRNAYMQKRDSQIQATINDETTTGITEPNSQLSDTGVFAPHISMNTINPR